MLGSSSSFSLALSATDPSWVHLGRIAPGPLWEDPTDAEMRTIINRLKSRNVSVIEADSILSYWLAEAEFGLTFRSLRDHLDHPFRPGLPSRNTGLGLPILSSRSGGSVHPFSAQKRPDPRFWDHPRRFSAAPSRFRRGLPRADPAWWECRASPARPCEARAEPAPALSRPESARGPGRRRGVPQQHRCCSVWVLKKLPAMASSPSGGEGAMRTYTRSSHRSRHGRDSGADRARARLRQTSGRHPGEKVAAIAKREPIARTKSAECQKEIASCGK